MNHMKNEKEFWAQVKKISPEGCWLWTGTLWRGGYGQFIIDGKPNSAHRLSYFMAKGKIPFGKVIRHTCDVRRCVQPRHLIYGTHRENTQDMFARGRARGAGGVVKKPDQHSKSLPVSFYLPREDRERIAHLAAKWELSMSAAISLLIRTVGEHKPGGSLVAYVPNREAR